MSEHQAGATPSRVLGEHGLRPRKSLGQNFLQDVRIVERVAEALDPRPDDAVLEIGPGTGVLTQVLAARVGRVIAVELDDELAGILSVQYADTPGVRVLRQNALDVDPCSLFSGPYKVVGNIPYYITGPIVRHYLESACRGTVLVFMVQREVADRMVAQPGKLSLMGVSVQVYAEAKIMSRVPAGAFFPRPKVDSAIVRLTPRPEQLSPDDTHAFFRVARAGFGMRRKQLINALSANLHVDKQDVMPMLETAGIEPARRAESLSIAEWWRLAEAYRTAEGVQ